MSAPSGSVSIADLYPAAAVLDAIQDDGDISGSEWVGVLVSLAFMGVFVWRMARRRATPASTDEQA